MDRRKLRANNRAAYFHLEKKQEKIIYYIHKSILKDLFFQYSSCINILYFLNK